MCGIVGIADASAARRFNTADVERMANRILHRGPDDAGIYDGGETILGMRRLSIIDLSGGHQPISNEDGSIWVVCNGEIYNFRELRADLEASGHTFRTRSDTEVLVHLYEEHGDNLVSYLEGMYGFALWDARQRTLLIARDRLGIKPVYYWCSGDTLAFASEIKAFFALPGFSVQLDPDALRDHLAVGYSIAPRTIFAGVSKLPPGTLLRWRKGRISLERYWSPPDRTDPSLDAREWADRIRGELERAVESHMVSDVPLGAFLSGGIDSSAVAVLMSQHSAGPLNTYSIGYGGGGAAGYYNELPYARIVAAQLGSKHREIEVRPDVAQLLPKLIWHLEEPISDSAIATTYLVSELAAQSVKVILSGLGGDELFAGYNRYLGAHYNRKYLRLPSWARRALLPKLAALLPSGRQNRLMDLARYAKRFIRASDLDWRDQYRLYVAISDEQTLMDLGARSGPDGFDRVIGGESAGDELLRLLRVDWQTQLAESLLLLTDKMTMACSIECRVPFLDHRLVEAAAQIPSQHKLPDGKLKAVLKDALRGVLPDSVLDRRKRGFGAPVGAWFKHELSQLLTSLLSPDVVAARGLLNPEAVGAVVADHVSNREDYTDLILVLLNLEVWARLFIDGRTVEDVAGELMERSLAA